MANAIAIGGYGAVFWMWLIAIVGGATAFVESTLAQIYKKKDPEGGSYGGPSYYIQAALKSRVLGVVFAIALIATYAGGFNMLASYNLISSFTSYDFYASAGTFTLGGKEYSVVAVVGGVTWPSWWPPVYWAGGKADRQGYRRFGPCHGCVVYPDGPGGHGDESEYDPQCPGPHFQRGI